MFEVRWSMFLWFAGLLLLSLLSSIPARALDLNETNLPPAAGVTIDFNRDIKPILDTSCIRCHGAEKPKSGFRLDSRAAALKGGDNGVDIMAGNSGRSPLVHYAANLVPDMEMPPPGKGERLTTAQIGLLRAWIDQGLPWDAGDATNDFFFSVSPIAGGTKVTGNEHKFRELEWQLPGPTFGVEQFELFDHTHPDTKAVADGWALRDNYKLTLSIDRIEHGFVRVGWQQYRKYFDDTGGYRPTPATPVAPHLGEDLHLDIGKAWIDVGLTLPNLPRMVAGYEYDYKRGDESTSGWGSFGPPGPARNTFPTSKQLNEGVHIIKFDLDTELWGTRIEDNFRGEFYRLQTAYTNLAARGPTAQTVGEGTRYFQGANSFRLEKQWTDWLFSSAGYFYSRLNADGSFSDNATYSHVVYPAQTSAITLERESHVINLNSLAGPFNGLIISAAAQAEWTRETGFGTGMLHKFTFTLSPPGSIGIVPTSLSSDYDQRSVTENIALRYFKIPFTSLFAEAHLQQESIGQFERELQPSGNFLDDTSFSSQLTDFRAGFNTSPWRCFSWSAHVRRYEHDNRYANNQTPQPDGGYPGFLRSLDIQTDEIETRGVWHPCYWLKTTLSYQLSVTDYHEDTRPAFNTGFPFSFSPGGNIHSGRDNSRTYSIAFTFTPHPRLFLTSAFSYHRSIDTSAHIGPATVVPYQGDIYSVNADATCVVAKATDVFAGYSFSEANYSQTNFVAGVPVGIKYQQHDLRAGLEHHFNKNVSARLQYRFDYYAEPSSGNAGNFRAHAVFATLTCRLP
jgi:hypothetical protein